MLQDKRKEARSVLLRILEIGLAVGVTVGVVAFASKSLVSGVFTQDLLVSQEVQRVMPIVGLFMVSCLASEQPDAVLLSANHSTCLHHCTSVSLGATLLHNYGTTLSNNVMLHLNLPAVLCLLHLLLLQQ